MITVLAGGVGAARFLQGLLAVHPPSDVTIISNVGDDAQFFGLHVSPDIDIVLYHLAGLADEERGFGLRGDTTHTIDALARFGYDPWFRLGDRDLATCVARTDLLRRGHTLSQATGEIARALGLPARLLPATDDPLRTMIRTDDAILEFQEYFVKRRAQDPVREIIFRGAETARPAPGVLEAIRQAKAILLAPSNPLVSIGPILAVPGIREGLRDTPARIVAVSPIVGGTALKGPAARMLRDQGLAASATTIARLYRDFLDVLVIDDVDAGLRPEIEALGLEVTVTDTIMSSMEKKAALARTVLSAAQAST
ncbi:MAG: 2-phospho-L-lactate transferase [Dehalococcoidia bacterium]